MEKGYIHPEITVKYGAVFIIFLLSGLSLQTKDMYRAISQVKVHSFIQLSTFLCYPMVMIIICHLMENLFDVGSNMTNITRGLLAVACMPPPVSSAIILTRACNGNEGAAIFNSVLGSLLGLIFTPIILYIMLGVSASVPLTSTGLQLSFTVLLPLCIGQWLQHKGYYRRLFLSFQRSPLGQCMLLLIIFSTFCDTFRSAAIENMLPSVGIILITLCGVQSFLLYSYWWLTQRKFTGHFSRSDTAAIMFCSTHKSLTLGIPMLQFLLHDIHMIGELALPLLVHHPLQMVLGGILMPHLAAWVAGSNVHATLV
ncbi:sodium/bile acid cotransporter 7-like isoform X2 [Oratosquilla oratoria]|uniref:sodium/bile acid cotransporter 7-like isoform X2 n=1 Tax=Oratosquilla oratoria TaxID=337810 RepID=UPI003F760D8B